MEQCFLVMGRSSIIEQALDFRVLKSHGIWEFEELNQHPKMELLRSLEDGHPDGDSLPFPLEVYVSN